MSGLAKILVWGTLAVMALGVTGGDMNSTLLLIFKIHGNTHICVGFTTHMLENTHIYIYCYVCVKNHIYVEIPTYLL